MVVLAISIVSNSGRALLSRQFVDMTRIRIESLLAAFPKLIEGANAQHTYVETDAVRYVFHPLEGMFLLLITNKRSNIIEDLGTLQLLSKVVPDICGVVTEESITQQGFELIFAFDEVITVGGNKVGINMSDLHVNLEMESHEEQLQDMILSEKEDAAKKIMDEHIKRIDNDNSTGVSTSKYGRGIQSQTHEETSTGDAGYVPTESATPYKPPPPMVTESRSQHSSRPARKVKGLSLGGKSHSANIMNDILKEEDLPAAAAAGPTAGPETSAVVAAPARPVVAGDLELVLDEKITCVATRDGGLASLRIQGVLNLTAHSEAAEMATIQFEHAQLAGMQLQSNPCLDRKSLGNGIIRPKSQARRFAVGKSLGVLRWRCATKADGLMPLSINWWAEPSGGNKRTVSIEYNLENDAMELHDVLIAVPLDSDAAPDVDEHDGIYRFNKAEGMVEWRFDIISKDNPMGTIEFCCEVEDEESFFPLNITFTSRYNYMGFKIASATSAGGEDLRCSTQQSLSAKQYTVE